MAVFGYGVRSWLGCALVRTCVHKYCADLGIACVLAPDLVASGCSLALQSSLMAFWSSQVTMFTPAHPQPPRNRPGTAMPPAKLRVRIACTYACWLYAHVLRTPYNCPQAVTLLPWLQLSLQASSPSTMNEVGWRGRALSTEKRNRRKQLTP